MVNAFPAAPLLPMYLTLITENAKAVIPTALLAPKILINAQPALTFFIYHLYSTVRKIANFTDSTQTPRLENALSARENALRATTKREIALRADKITLTDYLSLTRESAPLIALRTTTFSLIRVL